MAYPYEVVGAPVTPGKATAGGVLSVPVVDGALKISWKEIADALENGWAVAVFPGNGSWAFVSAATVDESGEDPVYQIVAGGETYESADPDGEPSSGSGGDNTVGSAVVGTATAG